jgi:sugar phosphate isomerase/epimerase
MNRVGFYLCPSVFICGNKYFFAIFQEILMPLPKLGLQLIVFGSKYKDMNADIDTILDQAKAAGFTAAESGTPTDPVLRKKKFAERGMTLIGDHCVPGALTEDKLDAMIKNLHESGSTDLCNSGLHNWLPQDLDNYKFTADILNKAGRRLRKEGIYFHYHNHDFEFHAVKGTERHPKIGMEVLKELLDPSACDFCIDVGWVYRGNLDPAEYLKALGPLVGYLHLKDTDDKDWHELGRGKLQWQGIIEVIKTLPNCRWAVWEQDSTKIDPAESARISRQYLMEQFNY